MLAGSPQLESRRLLERHLDGCAACRELTAELVKAGIVGPQRDSSSPGPAESAPRPLSVGRYLLIERLGEGGMGIVYSGYDPELDRKVAVKLIRSSRVAESEGRTRLMREARAMAKLSHPNVATVHDVGDSGRGVFITMELVEGGTLRTWAVAQKRSWREILQTLVLAGRGLAAAHAAGLVHRDFKPDNVLVTRNGQPRVTDFGLASVQVGPHVSEPETSLPISGSAQTETGTLLGTPAYMAPEQRERQPATALSDQYSFCMTLHELLFGTAPSPVESAAPQSGVPSRVRRAILRGASEDPAKRFPSMDALLVELSRDPGRWVRRAAWLSAPVLAVALTVGGVHAYRALEKRRCRSSVPAVAGIWDATRKKSFAESFAATQQPSAVSAWKRLEHRVDAYVQGLVAKHVELCELSLTGDSRSSERALLQQTCVDRLLSDVRILTQPWSQADAELVRRGAALADVLEPVSACASERALRRVLGENTQKSEPLRERVLSLRASVEAGKLRESATVAAEIAKDASGQDNRSLEAEALLLVHAVNQGLANLETAEASAYQALVAAEASGRDDLILKTRLAIATAFVDNADRRLEAQRWMKLAGAVIERNDDLSYTVFDYEISAGKAALQESRVAQAEAHFRRAVETGSSVYGKDHPSRATALNLLGRALRVQAQPREALSAYEEAQTIVLKTLGPDHPELAQSYTSIGRIKLENRDLEGSAEASQQALSIQLRVFGPSHPLVAAAYMNLASVNLELKRLEKAVELYELALKTNRAALGEAHPKTRMTQGALGHAYVVLGQFQSSLELCLPAVKRAERNNSVGDEFHIWSLACVAESQLGLGKRREAVATFEKAERLAQLSGQDTPNRFILQFKLATALPASQRKRATALVRSAQLGFKRMKVELPEEIANWVKAAGLQREGRGEAVATPGQP
ncbi:MAG: protein kinase domain-containing protein [Myxococcaceae bacterium]